MRQLIYDIWDALRGFEHDYTRLKLTRAILLLAIPMVLEMVMESIFALVDIYFVSKMGDAAVAVVGLTESLMTVIYSIGVGLAMGTTAIVARRIGEKQDRKASIASEQAILLGIIISAIIAIPGVIFSSRLLEIMHAENKVIEIGQSYTQIMLGSNFFIILLFINNAVFRSAGAPALSLRVLVLANVINIILDPCLIFGLGPLPELGVKGAAIATTIGRGIGVIYQFYLLFYKGSRIEIFIKDFGLKSAVMAKVLYLSLGGIFQYLVATASWIILYRILAEYKSEVISGYTIALRIFAFFLLPSWGLSNAVSTLVGQNLGAKKPERAERSVWITSLINSIYMLILMSVFLLTPEIFIRFFSHEGKHSFEIAIRCLQIIGMGMIFYGFEMIIAQAFNGAGDTYTPTILNILGFWLIQIPLAYILAKKIEMRQDGVFYSIFIAETVIAILGIIIFRLGKWKKRQI